MNFLTFSITLSIKNGISQIEECICDCFESIVELSSISLCDMVAGVAPSASFLLAYIPYLPYIIPSAV